jgi:hypothetical protein
MARKSQLSDFIVAVDGIGNFTFAKRTMGDEIAIQVAYAEIIDGVKPTAWLETMGGWLSALRVLTVRAPDGWDIDAMDPLDDETYLKLGRVHAALTEWERTFREKQRLGSKAGGESATQNS